MTTQLLNAPDDCEWVRGKLPSDAPGFLSFIIEGNEDAPDSVTLYADADPSMDDEPAARYTADNETGNLRPMTALEALPHVFADNFMEPQIEETQYYRVETTQGTETVMLDVSGFVEDPRELQSYCEGTVRFDEDIPVSEQVPELRKGWLARLSAPGYMDCTDWTPCDSAEEAAQYLIDQYGA